VALAGFSLPKPKVAANKGQLKKYQFFRGGGKKQ